MLDCIALSLPGGMGGAGGEKVEAGEVGLEVVMDRCTIVAVRAGWEGREGREGGGGKVEAGEVGD